MTKHVMCSVFDSAVGAYNRPFFAPSSAAAVRSFSDEVNRADPQNVMFVHPEDYHLSMLGEFEDTSGEFVRDIRVLVRAKDVQKEVKS